VAQGTAVEGSRRRALAGRPASDLRKLRPLVVLATFILATAVLYWARTVLIPIAVATLLAFLLTPLVTFLQRRGLRRSIAVTLVVVLSFSVLGGVGWILTDQVWSLAEELPQYRHNIRRKAADLREVGRGGVLDRLQRLIDDVLGEIHREESATDRKEPVPVIIQPDRQARLRQLPGLVEPLVSVALVLALVIFMLGRQVELRTRVIRLIGYGRLPRATKALDEAADRVSHYLLTLSVVNGSFAVAVGIGLFLIGVPYAILWALLAGTLRFVPYVGAWLAALMPLALAVAVFHGWVQPLLVLGLFLLLEPLIFLVVEPLLYRTSTGVSDIALLVAVFFWSWLWGPVGLLLATPLTVWLVVLAKYVPDLRFLAVLLGEVEDLEPDVAFYQRLLAEDEDEATEIVEEFVRTHPPEQIYDAVLLPALTSLKQDRGRGALTQDDARFILSRTREIAEELALRLPPPAPTSPERLRILACPARDEVDEVALVMFRQVLDGGCCDVEVVSTERLSSEVVALARSTRSTLICVATVPPGGLAHARYLVKRLRAAVPEARIVVGRWGRTETREEVRPALLAAGADEVGMSILETRDHVLQLLPVLTAVEANGTRLAG
jgi:predicted PurR-regulated permease PerM